MRRLPPLVISTLVLVAVSGPAAAINEMFAKDSAIAAMTDEDFRIAGAVMREALEEGQDGRVYEWKNAATSASGTITPLAAFERAGMHCRGVKFTIKAAKRSSASAWNLCKTPGGWKVAEGR